MVGLFGFLCLVTGTAWASTFKTVEVICPLCNTKFQTGLQMSGTTFGQRLDLKPVGPIAAPWPLPVCPKDHFVVFKEDFSEQEKESLRGFVNSKAYQDQGKDTPYYFLLAKIYEFLGEDNFKIAYTYLKASWQADKNTDQEKRCLEASFDHLIYLLSTSTEKDTKWENAELLSGEIERRLGRFDEAGKRFQSLSNQPEFKTKLYAKIIKLQIELIEKKDTLPHEVPRDESL
jgi:uncharacterized protein (DUF2225 family)